MLTKILDELSKHDLKPLQEEYIVEQKYLQKQIDHLEKIKNQGIQNQIKNELERMKEDVNGQKVHEKYDCFFRQLEKNIPEIKERQVQINDLYCRENFKKEIPKYENQQFIYSKKLKDLTQMCGQLQSYQPNQKIDEFQKRFFKQCEFDEKYMNKQQMLDTLLDKYNKCRDLVIMTKSMILLIKIYHLQRYATRKSYSGSKCEQHKQSNPLMQDQKIDEQSQAGLTELNELNKLIEQKAKYYEQINNTYQSGYDNRRDEILERMKGDKEKIDSESIKLKEELLHSNTAKLQRFLKNKGLITDLEELIPNLEFNYVQIFKQIQKFAWKKN